MLRAVKQRAGVLLANARSVQARLRTRQDFGASSIGLDEFDADRFKRNVLEFVSRLRTEHPLGFRYSQAASAATLYSSAYACMIHSLVGELGAVSEGAKAEWVAYFNSYQDETTGLFIDPVVDCETFRKSDWWGGRHLALHMIVAYTALNGRPRYPFSFLREFYHPARIERWLDSFDWNKSFTHAEDIDNKIMNIGALLQYQRDAWGDVAAGAAARHLQDYLLARVNPQTGMWGKFDAADRHQLSRMVQFAYHLFPLYFYDSIPLGRPEAIVDCVLATQNELGGFGVNANSSACEDIDSIDILTRFATDVPERRSDIDAALRRAFRWVLCNQVNDGGFVFRLHEPFVYGHREMGSKTNQGALFPTWFRTLSLAYLSRYFHKGWFTLVRAPGLEN